jgi:hypothetical protein
MLKLEMQHNLHLISLLITTLEDQVSILDIDSLTILYADYNIVDDVFKTPDNAGALKLPSYGIADAGITTRFGNEKILP